MSPISKKIPVDYIVAIDPGYATQGIFIYRCGDVPTPICSRSTTTDNSKDIWARVEWQLMQVKVLLDWLGTENILLVLEEYRVAGGQKSSPGVVYNRAFYDALFRERMIRYFRHAVTVHPSHVHQFAGEFVKEKAKNKKGKNITRTKPHPEFDGSTPAVLKYLGHLFPEVFHPSILTVESEFHQLVYTGKKPGSRTTKNTWVSHCTDAGVMGIIGAVSFVYDGFMDRLNEKQKKTAENLQETYSIQEDEGRIYR